MAKHHEPGWRPSADVIIRRSIGLSVLVIVAISAIGFVIAWTTASWGVAWSLVLGAGTVALISAMSWLVMTLVKRANDSAMVITVAGYLLKLVAIIVIFSLVRDLDFFTPAVVGLAFAGAVVIHLIVVSGVVLSGPGPLIGED